MSNETNMALFNTFGFKGLELRDYFAAKAMQGWIVSNVEASNKQFAEAAYEMADAMLAERGKVNE